MPFNVKPLPELYVVSESVKFDIVLDNVVILLVLALIAVVLVAISVPNPVIWVWALLVNPSIYPNSVSVTNPDPIFVASIPEDKSELVIVPSTIFEEVTKRFTLVINCSQDVPL